MHSIQAIVFASVLSASTIVAQSSFDPGSVASGTRNSWCEAEYNSCNSLCNDHWSANSCDPSTLVYTCTCQDGTKPELASYMQTIPFFECQELENRCVAANTSDARKQQQCMDSANCGTQDPSEAAVNSSSSTSSSASPTATGTPSSTSMAATTTTSGAAAASTTATNLAITVGQNAGLGIFAGFIYLALQLIL